MRKNANKSSQESSPGMMYGVGGFEGLPGNVGFISLRAAMTLGTRR